MKPILVINVVGLSQRLLGEHTPRLSGLARQGRSRSLESITPAVTCSAQATFLTGKMPSEHGIVGNGWYFRDLSEIMFWKQSNHLIQSEKIWDKGRKLDPKFTCANLFWWYNMYCGADWSVTPRPQYPADGRKIPDIYSYPASLRDELTEKLGEFPLFRFWGPAADIVSSRWITDAALHVMATHSPTLTLVYLPHLDYNLQRLGPDLNHPRLQQDLREVDALCGELIDAAQAEGRNVVVLSEYGITEVDEAIAINRSLRQAGWLAVREERGRELLDAGASQAFAVVDHQVAHIYVSDPQLVANVAADVAAIEGVERVLGKAEKAHWGLDHERSGELVAISRPDRWFSYYYWLTPERAPDFSTTVDIHRKPGYDPVELFVDPKIAAVKLAIGYRLAKKKLGFRTLMNVISNEATDKVKGSHGRVNDDPLDGPVFLQSDANGKTETGSTMHAVDVCGAILDEIFA